MKRGGSGGGGGALAGRVVLFLLVGALLLCVLLLSKLSAASAATRDAERAGSVADAELRRVQAKLQQQGSAAAADAQRRVGEQAEQKALQTSAQALQRRVDELMSAKEQGRVQVAQLQLELTQLKAELAQLKQQRQKELEELRVEKEAMAAKKAEAPIFKKDPQVASTTGKQHILMQAAAQRREGNMNPRGNLEENREKVAAPAPVQNGGFNAFHPQLHQQQQPAQVKPVPVAVTKAKSDTVENFDQAGEEREEEEEDAQKAGGGDSHFERMNQGQDQVQTRQDQDQTQARQAPMAAQEQAQKPQWDGQRPNLGSILSKKAAPSHAEKAPLVPQEVEEFNPAAQRAKAAMRAQPQYPDLKAQVVQLQPNIPKGLGQ